MQMPRRAVPGGIDVAGADGGDGAGIGEHGTVAIPREDDGGARLDGGVDVDAGGIDPRPLQGRDHVTPELVIADAAGKHHPEPHARRRAGSDGGRTAGIERDVVHHLLHLAKARRHRATRDDVDVQLSDDEQIVPR